mgnify:FL=1
MPHIPGHVSEEEVYDYGSSDLIKKGGNFQALYEKVLNIPQAGRNLYQQWLADRWKEAALNWGMSQSPDLNRTAVMDAATGEQLMVKNEAGEMVPEYTLGENVGEEFEAYLNRLKGTKQIFGDNVVVPGAEGGSNTRVGVNRLNQLNSMQGMQQREVLDALTGVTGFGAGDFTNEAFLNQAQDRFGRRGAMVQAQRLNSPEAARAFSISPTGQLDPTGNASFLNQRLTDLRSRYGF